MEELLEGQDVKVCAARKATQDVAGQVQELLEMAESALGLIEDALGYEREDSGAGSTDEMEAESSDEDRKEEDCSRPPKGLGCKAEAAWETGLL